MVETDSSGPPTRGPPLLEKKPDNNIQIPSTRREGISRSMILGDICESSFVMVISFLLGMYTVCSPTGPAGSGYIVRRVGAACRRLLPLQYSTPASRPQPPDRKLL